MKQRTILSTLLFCADVWLTAPLARSTSSFTSAMTPATSTRKPKISARRNAPALRRCEDPFYLFVSADLNDALVAKREDDAIVARVI